MRSTIGRPAVLVDPDVELISATFLRGAKAGWILGFIAGFCAALIGARP